MPALGTPAVCHGATGVASTFISGRPDRPPMPYCPACSAEIESVEDVEQDGEGYSDETGSFGTVMYSCPECEVVLGVSNWRSDRALSE